MTRLFVAIPLGNEWLSALYGVSQRNGLIEKLRWSPCENLHVTLFFIGETEDVHVPEVISRLAKLSAGEKSFSLNFEKLELIGKKKNPSMIWARFNKSEVFSAFSERIHLALKEFMTTPANHLDPIPHCTLARIKPGADPGILNFEISIPAQPLKVDRIQLWQTIPGKSGVRYDVLEGWFLE